MFNNKKRLFLLFDFLISVIIISNISYGELLKTKEKII